MQFAEQTQPSCQQGLHKFYIREADGSSYEAQYKPEMLVSYFLQRIYPAQIPQDAVAICQGKILDCNKSLAENSISPNQIVNIRKKMVTNDCQHQNYVYISYEDKLHLIHFHQQDSVKGFKQEIEKCTQVPLQKQVILFNGFFLEDSNTLKDYGVKGEAILNLGKVESSQNNTGLLFVDRIPIKMTSRSRRGSEGEFRLITQENPSPSKFANSSVEVRIGSTLHKEDVLLSEGNLNKDLQVGIQFGASSLISEEDPNLNFEMEDWVAAKSEEGNSPELDRFQGLNIFSQGNNKFAVKALQFGGEIMGEKSEESGKLFDIIKDQFSIQAEFSDLLESGKQEVVFCESYYEKEETVKDTPCQVDQATMEVNQAQDALAKQQSKEHIEQRPNKDEV